MLNNGLFYQLDEQVLYFNTIITSLYMFRALLCSSSGGKDWFQSGTSLCLTCVLNSHLKRVTRPDAVIIQYDLLRMNTIVLETCSGM